MPILPVIRPEYVLATNVEGEATAVYLSHKLRWAGIKVTRMGISVGSDIEHTDGITMLKAMGGRRDR